MQNQPPPHHTLRRAWLVALVLLAACAGAPAVVIPGSSTGTPSATPPLATPTAPAATPALPTATALAPVPRNRTLLLSWLLDPSNGRATNPVDATVNANYTPQAGNNLLWEGLAYYAIFADKEIPWLAQRMDYTKPDFTELTIKLNPLARWSDGQPVTAQDVLFTFDVQRNNNNQFDYDVFQQFVQSYRAVDAHTVVVTFKLPAPRFKFDVLTFRFDFGLPIMPAHVLAGQADITHFAGTLDIVHSGPYNIVSWDDNRKVYDLRPDWWAVTAGLIPAPAVQRVTYISLGSGGFDTIASKLINNELDSSVDVRTPVILNMLKANPNITTHSGNAPPYGYLDWWPNSLTVNTQLAPYSDVRVRRALSLAIDRDGLDRDLFHGAPIATIYPFPLYPGLQRFVDSPAVKALEAQYQPRKFDLAESARLMTEAGFSLNADGLWAKDGHTVDATMSAQEGPHADSAPVLVQMLRRAGFDARVDYSDNAFNNMLNGGPGLFLFGHGGGVTEPYTTLADYRTLDHSVPGLAVTLGRVSRYSNPAYDQIIAAMALLPDNDPKFQALAAQAMEIYWRDVIDIPVFQWVHHIPYNQTYWTNWPTQDNPALGTNGAFWAQTGMLVITSLKPAQ